MSVSIENDTAENDTPADKEESLVQFLPAFLQLVNARFVRVRALNVGVCPSWHRAAGEKAWLFADEVMVE